ncbi:MAG: metal-sensitive transcriptional regulator [Chloroflexi bacterium]|nr:metal-sensitive transcriptional regulator [Chloroflexota bacterium]
MRKAAPANPGYQRAHRTDALLRRLKRIEGQVRGIQRMVEEERYCVDILTQIDAITAALARVQDQILDAHLSHCVPDALEGEDLKTRRAKVDEIVALLRQFRRIPRRSRM